MADRRALNGSSMPSDMVTYDDEFGRRRSMGRAEYDAMIRDQRNRPPSSPRRRRSRSRSRSRDGSNGRIDRERDRYAPTDKIHRSRSPRALHSQRVDSREWQSYNDGGRHGHHAGPLSSASATSIGSNSARRPSNEDNTRSTSGYGNSSRSFRETPRVTHTVQEAPSRPAPSVSGSQAGSARWNPYSAYGTYSKPTTTDAYTAHPSAPVARPVPPSASLSSHSRPSNRDSEYHTERPELAHSSHEDSISSAQKSAVSKPAAPRSPTLPSPLPETIAMDHLLSNGSSAPYSSYDDYVSWSSPEAEDHVSVTKLWDRHTSTGATGPSTTTDTSTGKDVSTGTRTEATTAASQMASSQPIATDKQSQASQETHTDIDSQTSDSKQEQKKEKKKQGGSSDEVKVWRANILVVVKSVLHRYLDAKDITREDFKMAAKEATEKILTKQQAKGKAGKHLTETDVHRIESFTEDYVKYIRKKRKASQ